MGLFFMWKHLIKTLFLTSTKENSSRKNQFKLRYMRCQYWNLLKILAKIFVKILQKISTFVRFIKIAAIKTLIQLSCLLLSIAYLGKCKSDLYWSPNWNWWYNRRHLGESPRIFSILGILPYRHTGRKNKHRWRSFWWKLLHVLINAESEDKNFISSSLRRDFSSRNNDSVTLVLDTFNDGTTAFLFGTNPEGVRREALISNGGNNFPRDFNRSGTSSGKQKWKKTAWGYVTEMKIPYRVYAIPTNATQWRVNVYRRLVQQTI